MYTSIIEFAFTALLIELTPGPNMAYLAALTLAEGRRVGLTAVAGIFFGLAIVGVLAALGMASIIDRFPILYSFLRYAGCAFLLYLAWDGWRGAKTTEKHENDLKTVFLRGLMTNVLNPKSALFYVSVLPLFIVQTSPSIATQTFVLAAIYVTIATLVHGCIVLFADSLRPYLVSGSKEVFVRRGLAVSLAAVAVWFFWGTRQ